MPAARAHGREDAQDGVRAGIGTSSCAVRGGRQGEFFARMKKRFGVHLEPQGRGDVGDRMHRAFKRALRRHPYAVLIGSDCPALRPADLRAASRILRAGADAVIAPAEDGGYPLIGLRRVSRRLFDGIPWGGPEVLARTRRRSRHLRWHWRELSNLGHVDRPEDGAPARRPKLRGGPR